MEIKRPLTNLIPDKKYALSKEAMNSAFLFFFRKPNNFVGNPQTLYCQIGLSPVFDTSTIFTGKAPKALTDEEKSANKEAKAERKKWMTRRAQDSLAAFTTLKKVNGTDPHFIVSIPILKANSSADLALQYSMLSAVPAPNDALDAAQSYFSSGELVSKEFTSAEILSKLRIPTKISIELQKCLLGVRYVSKGASLIVFIDFKLTAVEAESLVSIDWLEIRSVDLYPLFASWVGYEYVPKNYSKVSFPLSKIASTLPPHAAGDTRIDSYGIAINMDGDPLYIPEKCDNTNKYESMFIEAGSQQDQSFSLRTLEETTRTPKLPVNIPILVDWINNKFTYSNSTGNPVVMPLEHLRKCNASMAYRLMAERLVPEKYISNLATFAQLASVDMSVQKYIEPSDYNASGENDEGEVLHFLENQAKYGRDIGSFYQQALSFMRNLQAEPEFVPRFLDLTTGECPRILAPVARFLSALYRGMLSNLEVLYARYAVTTITNALGKLAIVVEYGKDVSAVRIEKNTINQAAVHQGLDPNWVPPSAPMITSKFSEKDKGLLPHQARARNMLRESPDFAVLSVDAGGGKSMLSITDILYEIKAGRNEPYIIMCPSHLVANYVAEIVEFTDGKINVLPITSYNIRTTGYERYQEILTHAPRNSIIVVDYDALKFRTVSTGYGTTSVEVYPVIEFLRQFKPGYVMMDESHFLKNTKSARAKAVLSLVSDIPKKRLASGTLNPDSPSDFPGQIALLDPTIFGTRDDFNQTYGADLKGNRVIKWRTVGQNSISSVLPKLRSSVVWVQAKRKEWAAALPERTDRFLAVELTPNQKTMYDAIFDDMIMQIKKDAAQKNKSAQKLLESLTGKKATKEQEEDFGDIADDLNFEGDEDTSNPADDSEDVGPGLQPYLADIERFVTDPAGHPYAKNGIVLSDGTRVAPLSGDDLKSPKILLIEKILREHLALGPNAGKIIVFCNYTDSVHAIFNAMPEDLQKCGILYSADQKIDLVNKFKTRPEIKWLVGIRTSLEVGLNLQQAARLVRVDGVWNPGQQEQGDSRIERPFFGEGGDKRPRLFFDTIVADRTYDVTKAARLRAKMVALAKFENPTDPNYQDIEDIPVVPMTLKNIQQQNDFATNLAAYEGAMRQLFNVRKADYDEYREKIKAEGGFKPTQIEQAPTPPDAKLLSRVPYVPGTDLYGKEELGLVRVDNYLGIELQEEDDDGEGEDEAENNSTQIEDQRKLLIGKRCHTDLGDGTIIVARAVRGSANINRVQVRFDDGSAARGLHATNVFVITRTETNGVDMRNLLAKATGLEITNPITVPALQIFNKRLSKQEKLELDKKNAENEVQRKKDLFKKKLSVGLELSIVNGFLRLAYIEGKDTHANKALQAIGFKPEPNYVYTRIKSATHLLNQARLWADKGFETHTQVDNDTFADLITELSKSSLKTHSHYLRAIGKGNFKNYLRTIWKPTSNKKELQMFALITDGGDKDASALKQAMRNGVTPNYGVAYLCLPVGGGHPGTKLAVKSVVKAPATRWILSQPTLSMFVSGLSAIQKILQNLETAGIQVNNVKEIIREAKKLKIMPNTNDKTLDLIEQED